MGLQDESRKRHEELAAALTGAVDIERGIAGVRALPGATPALSVMAAGVVAALLSRPRGDRARPELAELISLADVGTDHAEGWELLRAVAVGNLDEVELDGPMAEAVETLIDMAVDAAMMNALADDSDGPPGGSTPVPPLRLQYLTSDRLATSSAQDLASFATRAGPASAEPEVVTPAEVLDQGFAGLYDTYDAAVEAAPDDRASTAVQLMAATSRLNQAHQHGGDLSAELTEVRRIVERLPADDELRTTVENLISMTDRMAGEAEFPISDEDLDQMVALADRTERPDLRAMAYMQAGMTALAHGQERDLARVDAGIDLLRRAVEASGPSEPDHVFMLASLALGLFRRSELTGRTSEWDEARSLLASARALAGGPHHPVWSMIQDMLAALPATRSAGETQAASMAGLRKYLGELLVRADPAVVEAATRDATAIARQCLRSNDPAGAMAALDAGRGIALFAALVAPEPADRLALAGRRDLSEAWRATDAARPTRQLRQETLDALADGDPIATLLDPPSYSEIQRTLRSVDADALVYLVPGDDSAPGYAIVAPSAGPATYLALPALRPDDNPEMYLYLADATSRDLGPATGRTLLQTDADPKFAGSLGALCDWAWRSTIGPLIERCLPRLEPTSSREVPRLVLAPVGDLARVPWHAARRSDGVYAVELVSLSQTVSAGLLGRSAAIPRTSAGPTGLVVGDPDTGGLNAPMPGARIEAYAVRQSFYRGSRYLGLRPNGSVSPSGAATAAEVRSWLAGTGPARGSMVHLACRVTSYSKLRGRPSHLLLAGGEQLTAGEVAVLLGAGDPGVDLVVLSGAGDGLPTGGHDEAYSLGSAFLAGGARSVLATQWAVPDGPTAVLLYMVHHYRQVVGQPVWEALRSAQLWMLDPGRVFPDGMPADLRDQCQTAVLDQVFLWANCTHWGA
ncbi:CHAT domain-containing protein [Actinoplanes sp. LDG1-06]|uniref:CHAT domain-containing protein n=1 Tax=Paractinoplanes ovalisporus TaxID=2810368 RepID=A0ABS2A5E6_9ACTN|nr:CHAT domain-containing protein [Actinoplanes ovalisporus]MBM2615057.1 CHAT domain-containing protein [Actinoplanes ovalisporus]